MSNLIKLFDYLKSEHIKFIDNNGVFEPHWECRYKSKKCRVQLVKWFYKLMGSEMSDSPYYTLRKKRSCKCPNCVNPDCYQFITKKRENKSVEYASFDDVLELANEIDVIRYNVIGAKDYLKEFNSTQPEFLKINMDLLKATIKYITERENKNANRA